MFWNLLFAHFLADYPLQPNWMVRHKKNLGIMAVHAGIHLFVMGLLTLPASLAAWPYLVGVAVVHFLLDIGKVRLGQRQPRWIVIPYLTDQVIHYLVLALVALAIQRALPGAGLWLSPQAAIVATGFLLVTQFWYITERIIFYANRPYAQEVVEQAWPRMVVRGVLYSALFAVLKLLGWGGAGAGLLLGGIWVLPYRSSAFGRRAFLTDLLVSSGGIVFILLASWLAARP